MNDADLPGADLIATGLEDLARGRWTNEALLVAIGAPRLRALGVPVPDDDALPDEPEHRLWQRLAAERTDFHSAFNALRRRLVSYQRALDRRRAALSPPRP